MWDDRVLFVAAFLIAIALVISVGLWENARTAWGGGTAYRVLSVVIWVALAGVVFVILYPRWADRSGLAFPNWGNVIAVLIGAVLGSFSAKYVWSLFGSTFGSRDPLIGACVLALLSMAYSLPLYHEAITGLLSNVGLSSIKFPIVELTLRESASGQTTTTGASGSQMTPEAAPRLNDPTPGLNWLRSDTNTTAEDTLTSDKKYIHFLESKQETDAYKKVMNDTLKYLKPGQVLSDCLSEYVKAFPDSELLLVDIKPVIESLYALQKDIRSSDVSFTPGEITHFGSQVAQVLHDVNSKFNIKPKVVPPKSWPPSQGCDESRINPTMDTSIVVHNLQPYTTLVLGDLLYARGAQDEAIAVLAEWLSLWIEYSKSRPPPQQKGFPTWFQMRVLSRMALFLRDVAGQNNVAYRHFMNYYRDQFEEYISKSDYPVRLDQLPDKCAAWSKSAVDEVIEESKRNDMARKVFFLLLAQEDEVLRTEISFLADESNFEALEKLYRRASFIASIGGQCLPTGFSPDLRTGTVADHKITAGLLGLAVSNRMATIVRSAGDRDHARQIRRESEERLRAGWEDLRPLWKRQNDEIRELSWNKRIFAVSPWERSANLATRALSQLRATAN
jgi:hypothetical protein